jgi:hypothetical protein
MKAIRLLASILTNLSSINVVSRCEVKLLDGSWDGKWDESAVADSGTVASSESRGECDNSFYIQ